MCQPLVICDLSAKMSNFILVKVATYFTIGIISLCKSCYKASLYKPELVTKLIFPLSVSVLLFLKTQESKTQ